MRTIKLWPHGAVIGLAVAVAAAAGVWLYQRNSNNAQAEALPNAARIQRVDGDVALTDIGTDVAKEAEWRAAGLNEPFTVGDRIYTRDNGRTSVALSGRNYARLDPNTALDAVALDDDRTQLALREGSAIFDVGYLPSGELFEVGTPYGAVDFQEPGLYYVDVNDGNAMVSVLSGLAQVAGLAGSGRISKGEMLTLLGATAAEVVMSRLDGRNAGYLVDDYYRYQYPNVYDGRYVSYDTYLADPFYFDPYRSDVSYRYVNYAVPGINDLSYYGDWRDVNDYGYAWSPRVDAGWTPYSQGYWVNDYPSGLTWVSTEPWGYAPYHYGRWAHAGDRWYWVPDSVNTTPTYSPALVAFVPMGDNEVGWVPLGPGDPYVARYYDENWQPHYLTRGDVLTSNLVNWAAPNAVTVMPLDQFGRPIDPRFVKRVNSNTLAQVRPTLEPLLLTPLRNAALRSAWGRGKIDVPPGIAKKLDDTRVILGTEPRSRGFRKNLDKAMRVDRIDQKAKRDFKVKDERNAGAAPVDAGNAASEAARENRENRGDVRRFEQQQRKAEGTKPKGAEGQRIGNPAKPAGAGKPEVKGPPVKAAPHVQNDQPGRGAAKQQNKPAGPAKTPGGGGGKPKGKGKP